MSGKVQVVAELETPVFLQPGDFFGELAAIDWGADSAAPARRRSSQPGHPAARPRLDARQRPDENQIRLSVNSSNKLRANACAERADGGRTQ